MEVELRVPKGPLATELWRWSFYSADWSREDRRLSKIRSVHHLGAAGFFGLEDGENWGECTKGSAAIFNKRFPYHYAMNLGRGEIINMRASHRGSTPRSRSTRRCGSTPAGRSTCRRRPGTPTGRRPRLRKGDCRGTLPLRLRSGTCPSP